MSADVTCPHGCFWNCYECRGDELVGLRAQLAAVTKERDALRADNATLLANADADALMGTQVGRERDAFKGRVAALEAALGVLREKAGCNCDYEDSEEGRRLTNSWCLRHGENALGEISRAGLDAKEGG